MRDIIYQTYQLTIVPTQVSLPIITEKLFLFLGSKLSKVDMLVHQLSKERPTVPLFASHSLPRIPIRITSLHIYIVFSFVHLYSFQKVAEKVNHHSCSNVKFLPTMQKEWMELLSKSTVTIIGTQFNLISDQYEKPESCLFNQLAVGSNKCPDYVTSATPQVPGFQVRWQRT